MDASEVRTQFRGLKQEDISAFFISADKDEDGLITFEEYLAASLRHDDGQLDLDDYKFQWAVMSVPVTLVANKKVTWFKQLNY